MSLGKFNVNFVGVENDLITFRILPENKYIGKFAVEQMEELIEKGKDTFVLTLDKHTNTRSKDQNKLMWALLEIMALELSGRRTGGVTAFDCYIDMLESYGAKYDYYQCSQEGFNSLVKKFRATKVVERRHTGKRESLIVKCFSGSSEMDTVQMGMLIDGIFDRLAELGVSDTYQADISYMFNEWNLKDG